MNALSKRNALRQREITALHIEKVAAHAARSMPGFHDYPLPALKARIADALSTRWNKGRLVPHLEIINRERFGGDLSLKFPQLLEDRGPKEFIRTDLPWIVEVLKGEAFSDAISQVRTTGMYINIVLSDRWLIQSAQKVSDLGPLFGMSDAHAKGTVLVDYSSPNVAKVLHAGHIRSTIIGHVLTNLHEASGALVYRINHINDFGGFGFILEGYRRFRDHFPQEMANSQRLVEIYRIRRTLERLVGANKPFEMIDEDDRSLLRRYFPHVIDPDALKSEYQDFIRASDARFAALETGQADEVDLWSQMVEWSLLDFEHFYSALNIKFDLILGESFYFEAGDALIDECLRSGAAIHYVEASAQADIAYNHAMFVRGEITEAELDNRTVQIRKDIGAVVIPLDKGERFIVRRADGRSIYATRDLGAIRLRCELFHPTDAVYVVGEEQRLYFSQLFKAAYAINIATRDNLRFQHIYFGFYVDVRSGRKLSSRDSVANVNELLAMSIRYFRLKTSERGDLTEEELDNAAR